MQRFVIKKYVMAKDARHAIRLDKSTPVQDVWVDEDWRKINDDLIRANNIGFK